LEQVKVTREGSNIIFNVNADGFEHLYQLQGPGQAMGVQLAHIEEKSLANRGHVMACGSFMKHSSTFDEHIHS
jgi:hypothetical protein